MLLNIASGTAPSGAPCMRPRIRGAPEGAVPLDFVYRVENSYETTDILNLCLQKMCVKYWSDTIIHEVQF